jgi:hypothetical protein
MRKTTLALLVLTAGCKSVDPAPTALDDLIHFIWDKYDDGLDEELSSSLVNLESAVAPEEFEDVLDGMVSHLSQDQADRVGISFDPAEATGVFMARTIDCDMETLVGILTDPAQDELYVGVYDDYARTYVDDVDAFVSGASDRLSWNNDFKTTVLGASYRSKSTGWLRRVVGTEEQPGGLFARTVLTEPSVFDGNGNSFIEQDYHIEAYWQDGDQLLHVYALWKHNRLLGFDDEGEGTQRLVLNNLDNWDEGTEAICEMRRSGG